MRKLAFAFSLTTLSAIAQATGDPITGDERVKWAIVNAGGLFSAAGGILSAGWGTLMDQPREYDTHWDGFGKRYGMRLTGISVSNTMEAGLGAVWGEDPRYHRAEGMPLRSRIGHVFKMTFLAADRDGNIRPAYARYAGIAGSNFLSNAWRPDSEADTRHAVTRIGLGFVGRLSSNAFEEFWPDVRNRLFHHDH